MRKKELEAAFHENYPIVQYAFVQFLSEHIADCSRVFGGDLQQMLILSVIGQVFITNFKQAGGPPSPEATTSISASRLADVCGIPRETVRRKLKLLEDKNWIRQDSEQSWVLVLENGRTSARNALEGLNSRGLARLATLQAALERAAPPRSGVTERPGAVQTPNLGAVSLNRASRKLSGLKDAI